MPELPEVETKRRYIEKTSLNKQINSVKVIDDRILRDISPATLKKSLKGTSFLKTSRRGKYLLLKTSVGTTLLMHFGMSGDVVYASSGELQPKWTRVTFCFKDGSALNYTSKRMLGKISLYNTDNPSEIPDISRLGLEPLERSMTFRVFSEIIKSRNTTVHQVLMQQELIAGIGNIYSDEIAFQAGILPYRKTIDLREVELRALFDKMKWVLKKAVDLDDDLDNMGKLFIIPNRVKGGTCPHGHGELSHRTIGGRTSYYCRKCQK